MVCCLAFASEKWDSIRLLRRFIKCHQDNIMAPMSNTNILNFFALIIPRKQNRWARRINLHSHVFPPFFLILLRFSFFISAGFFCSEWFKVPSVRQACDIPMKMQGTPTGVLKPRHMRAAGIWEDLHPPRGCWHPSQGRPHWGMSPRGGLCPHVSGWCSNNSEQGLKRVISCHVHNNPAT